MTRPSLRNLSPKFILLSGILLTLLYALFSQGVYHPDEHFQILEYAHMKLFGTPTPQELAWEYTLMMRPGLQPLIAYGMGSVLHTLHLYHPNLLVFLLHLLSGIVSVITTWIFYKSIRRTLTGLDEERWYLILSFFLWFMAYLHVRFSSEMFSGNMLLLLLAVTLRYTQEERKNLFSWGLGLGILAGTAFITRYQIGFALLGFGIWLLVFARRWRLLLGMALGIMLLLGVGLLADFWLYGQWTCSPINYLRENILNSHIDSFGIDPWWYYLTAIPLEGGILYGLAVLVATIWFLIKHPKHIITWTLIPFLIAHQMVGHKEVRFLFPILLFAPYFLVLMARDLPRRFVQHRATKITAIVLVALNMIIITYHLTIPNTEIYFYRMMEEFSADKKRVAILNLTADQTYYSHCENVLYPRLVSAHFYMPKQMERRTVDSLPDLERAANDLKKEGTEVWILSEDGNFTERTSLPLTKIFWSAYPSWVMRYFNFNDWVGLSIRRKNIYRME